MCCPLLITLQQSWLLHYFFVVVFVYFLEIAHCSLTHKPTTAFRHWSLQVCTIHYTQECLQKAGKQHCISLSCKHEHKSCPCNSRQLKLQMSRAYCQERAGGQNCCHRLAWREQEGEAGCIKAVTTNPSKWQTQKHTWCSWVSSMLPIMKKVLSSHNYVHNIELNLLCEPTAVYSPSPNRSW